MIRTRFAPSPTGFLHVGGLRTALYSYLFARKNNGKFILRLEDTDQKRYVKGSAESLLKTLQAVGLDYDEGPNKDGRHGPYIQSQRTDLYRKYADELIAKEAAYPCFCTAERLEEMRNKQQELKQAPMYDRACLKLTKEEIEAKKAANEPFVIRQKIPRGEKLRVNDIVRGTIVFETETLDDQVLMKSDNFPVYHLANVIDDHLMEISHVIRGEEWLPSTPKHLILYQSFGWQPPQFAHLPLLLNKDKSKLSKRQGDVSVESYLEKEYLVPALINFIALLGWHPGKGEQQEIFTMEELINKFDLTQVHKAGAIFDIDKLDWFNLKWNKNIHFKELEKIAKEIDRAVKFEESQRKEPIYIFSNPKNEQTFNEKRGETLLAKCEKYINPQWTQGAETKSILLKALVTIEEKILKNPSEAKSHLECFFNPKDATKELILKEKMKVDESVAKTALTEGLKALQDFDGWDSINKLQNHLINLAQEINIKNGQLLWPMRVALSGEEFSPGTFEMLWALGKKESIKRLNKSLQTINPEA